MDYYFCLENYGYILWLGYGGNYEPRRLNYDRLLTRFLHFGGSCHGSLQNEPPMGRFKMSHFPKLMPGRIFATTKVITFC